MSEQMADVVTLPTEQASHVVAQFVFHVGYQTSEQVDEALDRLRHDPRTDEGGLYVVGGAVPAYDADGSLASYAHFYVSVMRKAPFTRPARLTDALAERLPLVVRAILDHLHDLGIELYSANLYK